MYRVLAYTGFGALVFAANVGAETFENVGAAAFENCSKALLGTSVRIAPGIMVRPSGKVYATDGFRKIIDINAGWLGFFRGNAKVHAAGILNGRLYIYSDDPDFNSPIISAWNPRSGRRVAKLKGGSLRFARGNFMRGPVIEAQFTPDGKIWALNNGARVEFTSLMRKDNDGTVQSVSYGVPGTQTYPPGGLRMLGFSADSRLAFIDTGPGEYAEGNTHVLQVIFTDTGGQAGAPIMMKRAIKSADMSPDQSLILILDKAGCVRLWSQTTLAHSVYDASGPEFGWPDGRSSETARFSTDGASVELEDALGERYSVLVRDVQPKFFFDLNIAEALSPRIGSSNVMQPRPQFVTVRVTLKKPVEASQKALLNVLAEFKEPHFTYRVQSAQGAEQIADIDVRMFYVLAKLARPAIERMVLVKPNP